ncbi:MAG: putative proteasome accessory factor [Actinomycetota bacterium]|jgi:proteasome accessory factor C
MTARPGPRPAEERLRRLLVMLPWLMERGEVSVTETAERFGMSEREVVRDLELAAVCGLPPFVDELIDVFIDEGMIWVGVPRLFTRPLRLNSVEAWELLAAGRAAMELPGADPDGPLGRGLAKLAVYLGEDETSAVQIDLDRPEVVDDLANAVRDRALLRFAYRSASSDDVVERTVLPRQLYSDRGEWYLAADDDRSGSVRTFRVDRIEWFDRTGEVAIPSSDELPRPGEWFADGSVPRVVVRLAPAARWVIERYPVEDVSGPDAAGWTTASLAVASEQWFVRLLVRLGPDVEVLEPSDAAAAGAVMARRILDRYERS